jgi:hypothetical protein
MNTQKQLAQSDIDALWHNQTRAEHGIQACRNALAEAKRSCCPHGTLWRDCHQHNGHVIAGQVLSSEETE